MSTRVLFIMGVGHSGSTILDVALGNHSRIESVGEIAKLHRSGWSGDPNRRCACGLRHADCEYWSSIRRSWTGTFGEDGIAEYVALQRRYECSRRCWPRLLVESWVRTASFERYAEMTARLFDCIAQWSGKPVIVDSSKAPVRAFALLRNGRLDVRLLHLVRDGRGVVWAHSRPRTKDVAGGVPEDREPSAAWRQSADWVLTNLESEWVSRRAGAGRATRIFYERFVQDPAAMLGGVGDLVGEELRSLGEQLHEGRHLDVGHNAAGNKMRMAGRVVLTPSDSWKDLSPDNEATFWRIGGWLARRYGYAR